MIGGLLWCAYKGPLDFLVKHGEMFPPALSIHKDILHHSIIHLGASGTCPHLLLVPSVQLRAVQKALELNSTEQLEHAERPGGWEGGGGEDLP